jgi:hypothetical protein
VQIGADWPLETEYKIKSMSRIKIRTKID